MQVGRLLVLKRAETDHGHGKEAWWIVLCTCGNKATVRGHSIRSGRTRSCGCLQKEMRPTLNLRHGHARKSRSPEYVTWMGIVARCTNPDHKDFKRYGGRGIGLYVPWRKDFAVFLHAVGEKPGPEYQIDRIKNNRGYEPGNVRWVIPLQQQRNRGNLRLITFNSQTKCLSEWAANLGISSEGLAYRLKCWSKRKALTKKPRKQKNSRHD
jgi:hypothetical protein